MSIATDMVAAYIEAEKQILLGQTVEVAGRKHSMASLEEVRKGRAEWERIVASEQAAAANAPRIGGLTFSQANFGN